MESLSFWGSPYIFTTKNAFSINEVALVSGSTGVSHNGIYRGKDLGSISNLNEYIAFRQEHGIDDKSYTDLYLGDYFQINDGTYNETWMVAHFDYYYNKQISSSTYASRGVVLFPKVSNIKSKMNNTDTTEGGYASSIANVTTCPAIANALQTVLGSYLLQMPCFVSSNVNANIPSMSGLNWNGGVTNSIWVYPLCVLATETQIFGSTNFSSSGLDCCDSICKLSVFNFISPLEFSTSKSVTWFRNVASTTRFGLLGSTGRSTYNNASGEAVIRPLIYIS